MRPTVRPVFRRSQPANPLVTANGNLHSRTPRSPNATRTLRKRTNFLQPPDAAGCFRREQGGTLTSDANLTPGSGETAYLVLNSRFDG